MDVLGAARSVLQNCATAPFCGCTATHTRSKRCWAVFRNATAMPAASAKLAPVSSSRAASTDLCAGEHSTIKARRAATGIVRGRRRVVCIDDVRFYRPHFSGVEGPSGAENRRVQHTFDGKARRRNEILEWIQPSGYRDLSRLRVIAPRNIDGCAVDY